jgi:hypothetical protein
MSKETHKKDLLYQFTPDARPYSAVGIQLTGKGGLAYQVAAITSAQAVRRRI